MAKNLEKFFVSKVKTLPSEEVVLDSEGGVKTVKPKPPVISKPAPPVTPGLPGQVTKPPPLSSTPSLPTPQVRHHQ